MLETSNYGFTFREDGSLHRVYKVGWEQYYLTAYQEVLAQQHPEMDAKMACEIAVKWLGALDVDTNQLLKAYEYEVTQPDLGNGRSKKLVPEFLMKWTKRDIPKSARFRNYGVRVEVLAPGPQLLQLSIEDRSLCLKKAVRIPGEDVLMKLPNDLFTNLWASRELSVSNVYKILHTSTAYQGTVLSNMLAEANWTTRQLGIPVTIHPQELIDSFVAPPQFGLRCSLETEHCLFEFYESGNLCYFCSGGDRSLNPFQEDSAAYYERMSHLPSVVSTNSAIQLAREFLRAVDVDVDELDNAIAPVSTRYAFRPGRPSNIWWISWWNQANKQNCVYVQIDGATKTPQRIRIYERKFCRRAGLKVENPAGLMAVPDPQPQRDPLRAHLNVWPQLFPSKAS